MKNTILLLLLISGVASAKDTDHIHGCYQYGSPKIYGFERSVDAPADQAIQRAEAILRADAAMSKWCNDVIRYFIVMAIALPAGAVYGFASVCVTDTRCVAAIAVVAANVAAYIAAAT